MLTTSDRTCPYGHGKLARQPGLFALTEVAPALNKLAQVATGMHVVPSGRYFTVGLFRCPTCGHIELVDMDTP